MMIIVIALLCLATLVSFYSESNPFEILINWVFFGVIAGCLLALVGMAGVGGYWAYQTMPHKIAVKNHDDELARKAANGTLTWDDFSDAESAKIQDRLPSEIVLTLDR